jgi:ubiquinone/menaquinone biosynthesis C-methylase UbiE
MTDLGFKLYDNGYKDITSIDISSVVINKMDRAKGNRTMTFLEMNISQMVFPDNTFDIIFDKGTLDTLLTSLESFPIFLAGVAEIRRVLKPTGRFLLVSFGGPNIYSHLLEDEGKMFIEDIDELELLWGKYYFYKVCK